MELQEFTVNDVQVVIKKTINWRTPGLDKIHNFWIKHLSAIHAPLTKAFNEAIANPKTIPNFLTKGNTR